ncbi:hypothetical protein SHKM778_41480 [Streptomyces sp. KM77-8]|uniref:Uncharacterized protein n=1 Tax=Streptomyces haneummycinicus TaxID=3074435 RepID=A0AAT9HJX7_9ACTN
MHNVAVEALIQLRHRAMLARLATLCEDREAEAEHQRPLGQVVSADPAPDGGGSRA